MRLFLISQDVNNDYDTYEGAIVAAENENEARNIHPSGNSKAFNSSYNTWCDPEHVQVIQIGLASPGTKSGVILSSFKAG